MASSAAYASIGAIALLAVLALLHRRTGGRSSPVAALAFVLAGPIVGVVLLIPLAVKESARDRTVTTIYGLTPLEYVAVMALAGLCAAAIAALAFTAFIRDELQQLRDDGARPRPAASPALRYLGLSAWATLEDVDRAYRDMAKRLHPDRGGDVREFKRLQRNYELAKRLVGRRRPASTTPEKLENV